jgi:hypothetical protein
MPACVSGSLARLLWMSACVCALLPRAAAAEPSGVTLNWVRLAGAETCVSASDLMNRVEERAGRVLFVRSGDAVLSVDGYVRAVDEPKGWEVRLAVSQADGQVLGSRDLGVLVGDECGVINEAVEFLVHITLDADGAFDAGIPLSPQTRRLLDEAVGNEPLDWVPTSLGAGAKQSPSETESPKAPAAAAPAEPRTDTPTATAPEVPSSAVFDVSAAAGVGQTPGVSFGLALHIALLTRLGWIFELGLTVWPTRRVEADGSAGYADVDLQLGSLAVCPFKLLSALALCAGGEYGRIGVVPHGFARPGGPSTRPVFDVFGSGVLQLPIVGPLRARGALSLAVPMLTNEYGFEATAGPQRLFRTFPIVAKLELGLGVQL